MRQDSAFEYLPARRCFAASISGTTFIECHNAFALTDSEHVPTGETRTRTTRIFLRPTVRVLGDSGFRRAGHVLRSRNSELLLSKRKLRRTETIQTVREKRETETQNLGFSSRPFVLCDLPVKQPEARCLLHERRNGQFVLQVTGHPSYGLPWGQDRLVPIFLATLAIRQQTPRITFESAAQMLDTFAMQHLFSLKLDPFEMKMHRQPWGCSV
jgi:hypothetical protein